uniref:portal protein n=1 Tax=Methylibium sp. TaxID=2067992 RepID=UPI0033413D52
MTDAATLLRRLEQLKAERVPHDRTYRDCFLYVDPIRADGFMQSDMTPEQIQQQRALVVDSTAIDSTRMLASAIMSGLVPSNARWFALDTGQESDDERRWLDGAATTLWENIHNSNFDAEGFEASLDIIGGGQFVLWIDEDRERGGLSFTQYHLAACYLSSTRADGRPDTLYRPYSLTAEQAVQEFGAEKVSDKVREAATKQPDHRFDFLHATYPRPNAKPGAVMAKNLPWASFHVEVGSKRIVRESGYHECPFVAPRWKRAKAGSPYGVGPVADALPDIKTLNELVRMELAAADLAVAGMWIAQDDGVLNPRTIKVGPRKVIVANSTDSMKPLLTGSDFNVSFTVKAELQRAIRKVLLSDQLQPQDGPAMTATEVHVRVNLIRQLLGPVYGRLQAEWLRPMIERCFGLAFRAGVFQPPPESLQGREFSVRYVSPMARAQKLEDVSAMDRFE